MKNLKNVVIMLLCLVLVIPAINAMPVSAVEKGADSVIYPEKTKVSVGETFQVTIYLENITVPDGAIGCDIPVKYDSTKLELVNRECIFPDEWDHYGLSLCKKTLEENPYWLRCVCNSKDLIINKNRNIKDDKKIGFIVTFKAKGTGVTAIETLETVGYQTAYVVNADTGVTNYGVGGDKVEITVKKADGIVGKIGDISGDGYTDSFDALLALKADAKMITLNETQLFLGDVNDDGKVSPLDASLILRYDAGLIREF